jgi:hypothetical protein
MCIALLRRSRLTIFVPLLMAGCGEGTEEPTTPPEHAVWGSLDQEASFPEGFTYVGRVREKADGRVLVADPPGQRLLRLDFTAGTADTLGREGQGPGEYRFPDQVFPLPGDSSILTDLGNGRLIIMAADDEFVGWIPTSHDAGEGRVRSLLPAAVDLAGRLYQGHGYPPEGDPPDSVRILRFQRDGGVGTTVAWSWRPEPEPWSRGDKRPMLTPMDSWNVGGDGRVAVARANGFGLDWYLPDGSVATGPRYQVERFAVGPEEQPAELAVMLEGAVVTTSVEDQDGIRQQQMRRGVPPGAGMTTDDFAWPAELPLLRYGGTFVTPWNDAWVTRMLPQDVPPRVEVFDSTGTWVGFIALPDASRVVGFGRRAEGAATVYLVRTDEMGLKWLSRYRVRSAATEG